MKKVHIIKERCVACHQCETACSIEHSRTRTLFGAVGEAVPSPSRITIRRTKDRRWSIPIKCRHCNPAPCFTSCPTGAIERDIMTGYILINENKCIGCKRCLPACPFGVIQIGISIVSEKRHYVAQKCDECTSITREGLSPACVASCPTQALVYTDNGEEIVALKKAALVHLSDTVSESTESPCNYAAFFSLKTTTV